MPPHGFSINALNLSSTWPGQPLKGRASRGVGSNGALEPARRQGRHRGQHVAVAQVHVPVVGPAQGNPRGLSHVSPSLQAPAL